MSHISAKDEYRYQLDAADRPENIVNCYVNFVYLSSICMYLNLKVVDVFSFHLYVFAQVFSRSQPVRESNSSNSAFLVVRASYYY
jgi:hypothetical protein